MDYITVGTIVRLDEDTETRYVVIHIDMLSEKLPAESYNVWIRRIKGQKKIRDPFRDNYIVSLNRLWV